MWTDAREAVVGEATKTAIFNASTLERTTSQGMEMLTCYAGGHLGFARRVAVRCWNRELGIIVPIRWHIDATEGRWGWLIVHGLAYVQITASSSVC